YPRPGDAGPHAHVARRGRHPRPAARRLVGVVLLVGLGLSPRQWLVAFGLAGLGLVTGMLAEVLLPPRAKPGAGD
ncbi:MAG TPA: hypothetical protein VF832_09255, partial [Longimicrobiales bacterium]